MRWPRWRLEKLIVASIPDAKVEIQDLARGRRSLRGERDLARIRRQIKLQQHQLVYKALGGHMGGTLHALQLQTSAPK